MHLGGTIRKSMKLNCEEGNNRGNEVKEGMKCRLMKRVKAK